MLPHVPSLFTWRSAAGGHYPGGAGEAECLKSNHNLPEVCAALEGLHRSSKNRETHNVILILPLKKTRQDFNSACLIPHIILSKLCILINWIF